MIRALENKSYVTLVSDTVIIKSKLISENINPRQVGVRKCPILHLGVVGSSSHGDMS